MWSGCGQQGPHWLRYNTYKHFLPTLLGLFYFSRKQNETIFPPKNRREPELTKGILQRTRDQRITPQPSPPPHPALPGTSLYASEVGQEALPACVLS